MSGLNQQFTKLSILYWIREFESRSLRKNNIVFPNYVFAGCCAKTQRRKRKSPGTLVPGLY